MHYAVWSNLSIWRSIYEQGFRLCQSKTSENNVNSNSIKTLFTLKDVINELSSQITATLTKEALFFLLLSLVNTEACPTLFQTLANGFLIYFWNN